MVRADKAPHQISFSSQNAAGDGNHLWNTVELPQSIHFKTRIEWWILEGIMHNGLAGKNTAADKGGGGRSVVGGSGRGSDGGTGGGAEGGEEKGAEMEEKDYFSFRAIRHTIFSLLTEWLFTCSPFGFWPNDALTKHNITLLHSAISAIFTWELKILNVLVVTTLKGDCSIN